MNVHHDAWVERARNVKVEHVIAQHGIKLRGNVDRCGPCPKCGGHDRFSINIEKQCFNCRGCKAGGDVISLVEHLDDCDFLTAVTTLAGPRPNGGDHHGAELRKVTAASFEYYDETGVFVYQIDRIEYQNADGTFVLKDGKHKKTFSQRRPDPERSGKWIWNVDGVTKVPYHLPELIKAVAGGCTILIVEGEGKVDALREINIAATCNSGGAGKWEPGFGKYLRGADVVLLADNDKPGRDHVDKVGASLAGITSRTRVLVLDHLPVGGDIRDWLDAGGTCEQLVALVEGAADWQPPPEGTSTDTGESDPPPLPFINMSNWDNEEPPDREWTVYDRFPLGHVTLFSGEGAAGKSTIDLHRAFAHVLGREWLNSMPKSGPAIFIDCEDDDKEMHRRAAKVVSHYQATFHEAVKSGLHLMSLAGKDAVMATASRSGKIEPTPLYYQLLEAAGDIKPVMISIASSANVFAGEENSRTQVQQFIGLLTRMAALAHGGVSLISHPSLTGINTDTGLSGTTQWHNAVRARCYLKGVKAEAGEQPDGDLREIVFKKNNYGPISTTLALRYQDGLYLPIPGVSTLNSEAQEAMAQTVFIDLLRRFAKENRNVSHKPSVSYAPALFAREDEAKRVALNSRNFEAAMRTLFRNGKIWNEPYGKPSNQHFRIAIKVKGGIFND